MVGDPCPQDLTDLDPLTPDQVAEAGQIHARLRAHRGDWGRWEGGKVGPDGTMQAPYAVLAADAQAAYEWLTGSGVLPDFDWVRWDAKRDLVRGDVSRLSPLLARAVLTSLVRQERFSDGALLGVFRHGIMTVLIGVLGTPPPAPVEAAAAATNHSSIAVEPVR
ncbi:MAG: DUF6508 domain-containing protein [Candidatus Phosphoribacter sp.]|nr:hypothetical protein [Actinomycetales bacterium]